MTMKTRLTRLAVRAYVPDTTNHRAQFFKEDTEKS